MSKNNNKIKFYIARSYRNSVCNSGHCREASIEPLTHYWLIGHAEYAIIGGHALAKIPHTDANYD